MANMGIIALESAIHSGERVNDLLKEWRKDSDGFLIPCECPRFGSGEGKGIIRNSVRDKDIYILVDVMNNSLTYKMDGAPNRMSPDDHYMDLKRVTAACNGKASRITVIMPFLYEGRQHRKTTRESLDCAVMLRELENMGVHSIITFDAHDPRMQNTLPLHSLENISPALQFTQALLTEYEDITLDSDHLMFIAPDEGATERVVFLASLYGINIGMFYKRRDYTRIIEGCNPIIAHDFCGASVKDKDCIVIDDMISSGGSMLDVSRQLKDMGAKRVFIFSTFGLFTNGMEKFDKAYEKGEFDKIFTTNLIYQKEDLLKREYYYSVNMNRYIAAIIDTMNKGKSLSGLTKPALKIKEMLDTYNKK
ncbi:ribose-phosphate pyrophosphokinase [Butyrivibrio sp. CB08]|uniref:ribose-phosphate pyrophosphokinase n=1 Tax=Butyrivibrio sp. CB08 TaxID=2364879 RepID=UPI000EA9FE28|nr:ribose-phosphate pyrophosphokinase [Butyrivibrio sp. CB08]RKM62335.1 ribose-phosphate pyrophosphokinase [Butyrivibrio sp. CB08]